MSPTVPIPMTVCVAFIVSIVGLGAYGLWRRAGRLRDEASQPHGPFAESGRPVAVGQLAAGIAHEINNPLAYVRANLALLREHWDEISKALADRSASERIDELVAEGEEILDDCVEGVDRAVAIVRGVRELSHAGGRALERTDVNPIVERVVRMVAPKLPPGVQIERALGKLPSIQSSPQQLEQVFLNLVVNAIQAVGETGRIVVRTTNESDGVWIAVEDDGCGIPHDAIGRIFEPFYTTKPAGKGTGLGLSISLEIVRAHGGEIQVESTPSRGTRLRVRIPHDSADSLARIVHGGPLHE